jgi:hypothetical protein
MTSDTKMGSRAISRNGLRAYTGAAFDVSDMCEAITMAPTLAKV